MTVGLGNFLLYIRMIRVVWWALKSLNTVIKGSTYNVEVLLLGDIMQCRGDDGREKERLDFLMRS